VKTLVISPVGEPCSGKSTFSLWLCQALKRAGIRAEFVPEVIKHDVFTPEGVARVTSGRFDARYLRQQHRLTRGFLGSAEVVVNDGALEPFLYYALGRVPPDRLPAFEAQLDTYRQEQAIATHRHVALDLNLPYDQEGRYQDQATACRMRRELFDTLSARFGIEPLVLRNEAQMQAFADQLIDEVKASRQPIRRPGLR